MVVRPFDARSRASCTTRSLSVSRALYTIQKMKFNQSIYFFLLLLHQVKVYEDPEQVHGQLLTI
jgi:hypothetical protein